MSSFSHLPTIMGQLIEKRHPLHYPLISVLVSLHLWSSRRRKSDGDLSRENPLPISVLILLYIWSSRKKSDGGLSRINLSSCHVSEAFSHILTAKMARTGQPGYFPKKGSTNKSQRLEWAYVTSQKPVTASSSLNKVWLLHHLCTFLFMSAFSSLPLYWNEKDIDWRARVCRGDPWSYLLSLINAWGIYATTLEKGIAESR